MVDDHDGVGWGCYGANLPIALPWVPTRPTSRSDRLVEEAFVMKGGAFQTYSVTPQDRLKFSQFTPTAPTKLQDTRSKWNIQTISMVYTGSWFRHQCPYLLQKAISWKYLKMASLIKIVVIWLLDLSNIHIVFVIFLVFLRSYCWSHNYNVNIGQI